MSDDNPMSDEKPVRPLPEVGSRVAAFDPAKGHFLDCEVVPAPEFESTIRFTFDKVIGVKSVLTGEMWIVPAHWTKPLHVYKKGANHDSDVRSDDGDRGRGE